MFKNKGNYPYPVLLDTPVDFKTSKMEVRYFYKQLKDGHSITIECSINNDYINQLIKDKKVCYAVQIESPNAFFRKMYQFYDEDKICVKLSNLEVIDSLDIGIALLAKQEIQNYYCDDFLDIYKDIQMNIHKNELIGVYPSVKQQIVSRQEVLKEITTIFNLKEDEEAKVISYNTNLNRIKVTIPQDIGDFYKNCKGQKNPIMILNSLILVPVLSNVLSDMANATDDDGIRGTMWYKTLYSKIKEISDKNGKSIEELLNDSLGTSQIIMQNMLVNAIKVFSGYVEESGFSEFDDKGDEDE